MSGQVIKEVLDKMELEYQNHCGFSSSNADTDFDGTLISIPVWVIVK
jgi:hypothetical protein